jgi:glycosyltransferase involved in cell wall biosynthesis
MIFRETMKIIAVVPVFNHGKTLRDVVMKVLDVCPDVMVVDDGSTDGGPETLAGLPVTLVRHPINRGKGAAIMTAAREAGVAGATHIVTIDADGQHDPADIPLFFPVMRAAPEAIIVGVRAFDPANSPLLSRFGRGFSNFWFRIQTGHTARDCQSGFRGYPLSVLQWLKLKENHYDFEVEVLVKAAWAGIDVKEVDISVYYPPPGERISHFDLFRDNLRLTLLNTRLTVRSIIPVPHRRFRPVKGQGEKITLLRPLRSLSILLTGNNSPEQLAIAGGLGIFLGALPLIACQTIVTLFAANFLRLNKLMALATLQICNPPLMPALCIEVGYFVRHGRFLTEISLETIGYQALERILEWFIGSLILGPAVGALTGLVIYVTALILKRGGLENG